MRKIGILILTWTYIGALYLVLPLLPLLSSLVFWRIKFIHNYFASLRAFVRHIEGLRQGPIRHYFEDVVGKVVQVPQEMQGSCVQCGNCCMNHQCAFLEKIEENKYQCGVYHSPLRRFSNCGSFPLNQRDIDRYTCPSYFVSANLTRPITIYKTLL